MPPTPRSVDTRDVPLEALRGIAALVVIAWHFTLSFYPAAPSGVNCMLCTTPLFAFAHGTAAVGVFFALSGYVLTRRFFKTGDKRILIIGFLKRWFRLFLPVFLSIILSWLLFHFHLYAYEDAGKIAQSSWLYSFGFSMKPVFDPNFWAALGEGFTEAIYHDNNSFNPILWTIHFELIGSFIVFAYAALIAGLRGHRWLVVLSAVILAILAHFTTEHMAPFIAGCLLAFWSPREGSVNRLGAAALIACGLVFIGYHEPVGFYSLFDFDAPMSSYTVIDYTATIGAILIMITFIGCAPLRRVLSGRVSRALGRLSFPIYLVHMILLCSVGSAVFAWAQPIYGYNTAAVIASAVLLPVILAAAALVAVVDVKWIKFVNGKFSKLKA